MKSLLLSLCLAASFTGHSATITEISNGTNLDRSFLIQNPVHKGSKVPLSYYADVNGVCKLYNFEKGVPGSNKFGTKALSLVVNSAGKVTKGSIDYILTQVVCLNESAQELVKETSILLENPKHANSEIAYSYYANQDGLCKAEGYLKAAAGSGQFGEKVDVLEVNADGNVTQGKVDYSMKQIICLDEDSRN